MNHDDQQRLSALEALAAISSDLVAVSCVHPPARLIASTPGFDAWMAQRGVGLEVLLKSTASDGPDPLESDGWRLETRAVDGDPSLRAIRVVSADASGVIPPPTIDSVSGVAARASLDQQISRWFARAGASPFALVFVDINAFKAVNDHHGHLAGDDCLRQIATQLTESVRDSDFVGRYGGDEFVVLLAGVTTAQELHPLVDRLRKAVSASETASDGESQVAASVGAALSSEGYGSARDLLAAADRRMYDEKRGSRPR
ncbi:Diguanylate cyclase DosC [Pirellulimonas nuda]|uniref:diguanylate cyclase n=1 Tax=Pirellulimonas nuda TaxID=2528009 RepID=A0A518DEU3_9BACT|nr:GGDEF domain-containing protein [Pirellulimonas nuda]QDU89998.1 Diguanylate cyclase DosC [Pirellulimonas nuda]